MIEGDEGWPLLPVMGSEHSGSTVMLCRKSKTQISLVMLFKSVKSKIRELVKGFGKGFVSSMSLCYYWPLVVTSSMSMCFRINKFIMIEMWCIS